jgi:adenylosuccinate synthase
MSTLVVVGAQWGDEGKGKVVDAVAAEADVVARFAGGNNAGHTLVVEGRTLVTHLVPSGCLYRGTSCVLGAGMVIDPAVLAHEIATLRGLGLLANDELRVSLDAHVIFPFHIELDALREDAARQRGRAIGTTKRGIGPAYEAKAARRGIRVRDLFDRATLTERLEQNEAAAAHECERGSGSRSPKSGRPGSPPSRATSASSAIRRSSRAGACCSRVLRVRCSTSITARIRT